jgi:hypothetical protein
MNKSLCGALLFLVVLQAGFAAQPATPHAAQPSGPVRTIKNLPNFPRDTLRAELSRPLFRSIEISPIEAWVVARAALYSAKAANVKIVHTEANGLYDKMLLDLASDYTVSGTNQVEGRIEADTLTVHLLIFKITDGRLGICFAHSDDARYVGYQQSGDAWVGILKDGQWKTISKPNRR